ncbi:MAG: ABC transporter permease [Lachnospiraceae bacterium]
MLLRCIQAENLKLKHSIIYFACILLPIIPAIMGSFNYLQNIEILTEGWYSLWTQITLFYSTFFYAPLIGLYASYLWRLEHMGHNWNTIMSSPISIPCLYFGKLAIVLKVTIFTQLWISILYFIFGKLCHLPKFFPADIFVWIARGTLAAVAIGSLQLFLSMLFRNFAVPIGIAFIGSVLSMIITEKNFEFFWPYSLMLVGMNSNKSIDALAGMKNMIFFFLSVFAFFFLFCIMAILYLKKTDVKS